MQTSFYVLAWLDRGLVTVDLVGGERLVLVFFDRRLAARCGTAIVRSAGGGAIVTLQLQAPDLTAMRNMINAVNPLPNDTEFAACDDARFLPIIKQLLVLE